MRVAPTQLLTSEELRVLRKLSTPIKIQDFLNDLPFNFETRGETYMSPRRVLKEKRAHCFEGALVAALALWMHGERPLLLDLKVGRGDHDHVVALFRKHNAWGAVSKTNHAVLRYREPIYRTIRELALSYFHEYFLESGRKTLRSYSRPFDLSRLDNEWVVAQEDLHDVAEALDSSSHIQLLTKQQMTGLRKADPVEIEAGRVVEWK